MSSKESVPAIIKLAGCIGKSKALGWALTWIGAVFVLGSCADWVVSGSWCQFTVLVGMIFVGLGLLRIDSVKTHALLGQAIIEQGIWLAHVTEEMKEGEDERETKTMA